MTLPIFPIREYFFIFFGEIHEPSFHDHNYNFIFRDLLCPPCPENIRPQHMLPLCFMEKMLSHFNGIRQINMKPPDFSVIHTGKAVIEPAADIDTDRTGIFPEQLFHRFVKQDRPCDNALMGKEPIQYFLTSRSSTRQTGYTAPVSSKNALSLAGRIACPARPIAR